MSENLPAVIPAPAPGRVTLAHAADQYRRYPGESLSLFSRVEVVEPIDGFRLQVSLSPGFDPGDAICTTNGAVPRIAAVVGTSHLFWDIQDVQPGERYEFSIGATVGPVREDTGLESRAVLWPLPHGSSDEPAGEETVVIAAEAQGRYLRYLPALYAEDEFMSRYLMLFESFWAPISNQIDQLSVYFDPQLTQAELLPWLASWIGLTLDERWPEDRRRLMLSSAVQLFRKRGTKRGLQEYLEVFTGYRPQIIEQGANNMRMGLDARLGPSIALGTSNRPHTFTVIMRLPRLTDPNGDEAALAQAEAQRRRMIAAIINAEKPAHTDYTLRIEEVENA